MAATDFAPATTDPGCPPGPICYDTRPPPAGTYAAVPSPSATSAPSVSVYRSSSARTYFQSHILGLLNLAGLAFLVLRPFLRASKSAAIAVLVIFGGLLYNVTKVDAAALADGVCNGATHECMDPSIPNGPTDPIYSSSPPIHLLGDALRLVQYTLAASFTLSLFTRTSMSTLVGLGLIIGGFLYDATKLQAASTADLASPLTAFNAAATSEPTLDSIDYPYPGGGSGNSVRIAEYPGTPILSELWKVVQFTLMAFLVARLVGPAAGQLHGVVPGSLISGDQSVNQRADPVSSSLAVSTPSSLNDGDQYTTIHHMVAGRMLSERKNLASNPDERSSNTKKKTIGKEDAVTTSHPGYSGIAALIALLLLATLMIPMALPEPTSTDPGVTLTKELIPTPLITAQMREATATFQRKDKPQSWYYRSGGGQTQIHPLLLLIPLILMGSFFVPALAAFAASRAFKENRVDEDTDLIDHSPPNEMKKGSTAYPTNPHDVKPTATATLLPRQETDPIWITYYSTTIVWPPAVTPPPCTEANQALCPLQVLDPTRPCTEANQALCPILVPLPPRNAVPTGICTESNQALCPIVLDRRGERRIYSAGVKVGIGKVALTVLAIAWFAAVAMAQVLDDQPVYLPVEPTGSTVQLFERKGTLYRNGSVIGAASKDAASGGWAVVYWACAAGVATVVGFLI